MSSKENFQTFLVEWNNAFPCDRWYRKKYNIGFNTPKHRALCQIDIMLEFLEDELVRDSKKQIEAIEKRREELKQGKWLSDLGDYLTPEENQEIFDNIDLDIFDNVKFDYGETQLNSHEMNNM